MERLIPFLALVTFPTSAAPIIAQEFTKSLAPPNSDSTDMTSNCIPCPFYPLSGSHRYPRLVFLVFILAVYLSMGDRSSFALLGVVMDQLSTAHNVFMERLSFFTFDHLFQWIAETTVIAGTTDNGPVPVPVPVPIPAPASNTHTHGGDTPASIQAASRELPAQSS
ncbi:hypothetical protein F5148DRAFT_1151144 [Russula earlei]|uniref:Uncharacterized protein n=1 Tax=Russula earlei TaxID=71964 RepID=A0ACC0U1D2_9AGAM|nr:hypothetical protein F5148DRAFT_1151144 [Russula earlei]